MKTIKGKIHQTPKRTINRPYTAEKMKHALLLDNYSLDFLLRNIHDWLDATPKEKRVNPATRLYCGVVPRVIVEFNLDELEELNKIIHAGIKVVMAKKKEEAKKEKARERLKRGGKYRVYVNMKLAGVADTVKEAWKIVNDRPFGAIYEVHDDNGIVEEFIPF
jgi:hypothetical protein